jgi:hypothetical protein
MAVRSALLEFYHIHEPSKSTPAHVNNLLDSYSLEDIVLSLEKKFDCIPAELAGARDAARSRRSHARRSQWAQVIIAMVVLAAVAYAMRSAVTAKATREATDGPLGRPAGTPKPRTAYVSAPFPDCRVS